MYVNYAVAILEYSVVGPFGLTFQPPTEKRRRKLVMWYSLYINIMGSLSAHVIPK